MSWPEIELRSLGWQSVALTITSLRPLQSSKRRWILKSSEHAACFIRVLKVKTSSVVIFLGCKLPELYFLVLIFISKILLMTIMASIFLRIDNNIIGLIFFRAFRFTMF